ncbi:putative glucuronosyltransferase [Zea mays]|uniref:Glycosyltransferases n=2 Tax=Zea mays TaxID=4577 RepID=B4FRL7_MAIZE|nr:beta3-glucuronyltransferase [Zea mays]ACF84760.1 unknown [Zea mays]ACN33285.1 unknown [Zea mays]ACN34034.1 unknown [Zea mays]ACN34348.1 unknown [Zea mays]AQK95411.1 putative beta-14-xylosyltransferase IRX9 [Zea mays]|eukprot:NP_001140833.1 beta3-glucuronyltransferase [Zea mays]
MGTGAVAVAAPDRAKQRRAGGHLWKKALLHFSLCFVMGFFTGFAPSSSSSWKSAAATPQHHPPHRPGDRLAASRVAVDARATLSPPAEAADALSAGATVDLGDDEEDAAQRRLLIVVTTTRSGPGERRRRRGELLRLAHTLRLVRPPVVWVVVEPAADAPATAEVLRGTGVMYRHLAFKPEDNFTTADAEAHVQRNAALAHVEKHRLAGVLHFADAAGVYDVGFFEQIRQIEAFGTWPVATMSAGEKKVVVEGPLCSASKVVGWFSRDFNDGTTRSVTYNTEADLNPAGAAGTRAHTIDVSGFAFNSSILWDPERWGRPTSLPDTSQDSIKFVQEVLLEDRAKLKGIPSDCSQIMVWQYSVPSSR